MQPPSPRVWEAGLGTLPGIRKGKERDEDWLPLHPRLSGIQGGPKINRNYLLEGRPLVGQASPPR